MDKACCRIGSVKVISSVAGVSFFLVEKNGYLLPLSVQVSGYDLQFLLIG